MYTYVCVYLYILYILYSIYRERKREYNIYMLILYENTYVYIYIYIYIYIHVCKFSSKCYSQTTPSSEWR